MATKVGSKTRAAHLALREFALRYPNTREDFPWGERVIKVGKKVFVFLGQEDEKGCGMSVKLPESCGAALSLPFAEPTAYGLGDRGWVTVRFGPKDRVPIDLLCRWIDESYRAVAPKKLVAAVNGLPAAKSSPQRNKS